MQKPSDLNAEVILVDDGSTDESGKVCDKLSKEHDCITVLHKSNGGQSEARNYGLSKANGDYVWFVDGDDYIDDHSFLRLCQVFKNSEPEIISICYQKIYDDDTVVECVSSFNKGGVQTSGISALEQLGAIPAWASIFQKNFLINNSLFFTEGIIHEDFEFAIRSYSIALHVFPIESALYKYVCQRKDSTMNHITARSPIGYVYSAINIQHFINQNNFDPETINKIMRVVAIGVTLSFERFRLLCDETERNKAIAFYNANKALISQALSCHTMFYKLIGVIFACSPRVALAIQKIIFCLFH